MVRRSEFIPVDASQVDWFANRTEYSGRLDSWESGSLRNRAYDPTGRLLGTVSVCETVVVAPAVQRRGSVFTGSAVTAPVDVFRRTSWTACGLYGVAKPLFCKVIEMGRLPPRVAVVGSVAV